MKNIRIVIAFIAITFSSVILAGDRSILFLQQETPGHIVYVSLNEKGNYAIVSIVGMGASTVSEQEKIPIKEFDEIWELANSNPLMEFILPEGTESNMADPDYYTVNIGGRGKSKVNVQIPVSKKQGVVGEFILKFKKFIPAKS
jgi:hypothetical protein